MSSYDKFPVVRISEDLDECSVGWHDIWSRVSSVFRNGGVLCVECYPGVFEEDLLRSLGQAFPEARIFQTADCFLPSATIESLLARELTTDRVFGRITSFSLHDLMDEGRVAERQEQLRSKAHGQIILVGTGAMLIEPNPGLLIYADLARWEIQKRQRAGTAGSIGTHDAGSSASALYKRGYFVDWRMVDQLKRTLLPHLDFLLDTNDPGQPKLISGDALRHGLALTVTRPFRVVPFFDPGPWGGQWMRRVCNLPDGPPNYAWCFDCVPEENSLLLGFGKHHVEVPSQNLVYAHPVSLLGNAVHARFGTEFPIRFDFLDTMGGGNLSLQVHPLTEYIQQHFGMHYTQDESYYLLDAEEDACVYLGFKEGVDREEFGTVLREAQSGGKLFSTETYVNRFPASKHDHFLIPAGTIHCSGKNSMVLEISATPYIFTFKLWDWARLGMDGRPRPIHLEHGMANLQWDRDTAFVKGQLISKPHMIAAGQGWREEHTGLHEREFIETRRHWFTTAVNHHTGGGVNVLNLVEGAEAIVESPSEAFEPFVVHYAETFILPAAVGAYSVRPGEPGKPHATVKAFVRTSA